MAVLKNKTQGNYTIVSQNIMRDKSLTLAERGMLLTLLSLPDNWEFTIMGLCQILPEGKDKIANTLNALIKKGYVTREQSRSGGGRFGSTDLVVHETPIMPFQAKVGNVKSYKGIASKEQTSPCPTKPDAVIQNAEEPNAGNNPGTSMKKNSFCDFQQRTDYDFDEIERLYVCN